MKFILLLSIVLLSPSLAYAEIVPGTVLHATAPEKVLIEEFDMGAIEQEVTVQTEKGPKAFINDFTPVERGDAVFVRIEELGGEESLSLYDINRSFVIYGLFALFVIIVFVVGGKNGVRSLLSLFVTFVTIFYVLIPLLKNGYSPTIIGSLVAIVLLALVMLLTHGFRTKTYIAMGGTAIAIIITALLTRIILHAGAFTGVSSDEAFSIVAAGIEIDMVELLFVGILIGMLGVLDDVAITQTSVVAELKRAHVSGRALFVRAMHVGRDHIGALVNTLVLAYAGTALPLLMLTALREESFATTISIEVLAVEIVRALIGSIGIILAVPITTFLAMIFAGHITDDEHSGHHH